MDRSTCGDESPGPGCPHRAWLGERAPGRPCRERPIPQGCDKGYVYRMVVQDRPPSGSTSRTRVLVLGLLAVAALLGGLAVVAGQMGGRSTGEAEPETSPPPTAPATSSTTEAVSLGRRLVWQRDASLEGWWPVALVEHEGVPYFFARPQADSEVPVGTGLDGWVRRDETWDPLPPGIEPPNLITSVSATPHGLVALGTNRLYGEPRLWISSGGGTWSESALPLAAPTPGMVVRPVAVAGTEEILAVFGVTDVDIMQLVADVVPDHLVTDDGIVPFGFSWTGDPFRLTLHAPLGLTVFSATSDDLGLSDDQLSAFLTAGPEVDVTQWTSSDGGPWTTGVFDARFVTDAFATPEGELAVVGGDLGQSWLWMSGDGTDWEQTSLMSQMNGLQAWDGGWLAARTYAQTAEVVRSPDATDWEPLGLEELLGDARSWYVHPLASGAGGIAAAASGYSPGALPESDLESASVERDGYVLTINPQIDRLTLVRDTDVIEVFLLYGHDTDERLDVDAAARTVSFVDPEVDQVLVTFTFDELHDLEQAMYADAEPGRETQLLLFSPDGNTWSRNFVAAAFGVDRRIDSIDVSQERVVVVTADEGPASPSRPFRIDLWSAPIP